MRSKILNIIASVLLFAGIIFYILLLVLDFCYVGVYGEDTYKFLPLLEDKGINYFYVLIILLLVFGTSITSVGVNKRVISIPLLSLSIISNTFFLIMIFEFINSIMSGLSSDISNLGYFFNYMAKPGLILGLVGIGLIYVADVILIINKALGKSQNSEVE